MHLAFGIKNPPTQTIQINAFQTSKRFLHKENTCYVRKPEVD